MLRLGQLSLGETPQIAAIAERAFQDDELKRLHAVGIRLLEIRADAFPSIANADYNDLFCFAKKARKMGFSLLGTLRECKHISKGRQEIDFYTCFLPYVDAIDIEYENKERKSLIELAKKNRVLILLSAHNFLLVPNNVEIENVVQEASNLEVDIVKLAYYARSQEELMRLAHFAAQCKTNHLVWMAMGQWGLLSRVMAFYFRSLFSYAFVDRPNAPGQFSVEELHQELLRYHPQYKEYIANLDT